MQTSTPRQISGIARFFAVILAILLTVSLILCILDLTFSRTLFSSDYVQSLLVEQKTYDKIPQVISASFLSEDTASANPLMALLTQLPQEKLNHWIASILTHDYLKEQTDHLLNSVVDFINLRSFSVDLRFDLAPVKTNIAGEVSQNALLDLFNSLPDCSSEQLNALTSTFMKQGNLNGVTVQLCKPGEPLFSIIQGMISSAVTSFSKTLPDQVTIGGDQLQNQVSQFVLSPNYRIYYFSKRILDYSPLICLGLVLLIGLFTLRSAKYFFKSVGVPLLVAGIITLLGAGATYASLFYLSSFPFIAGLSGPLSALAIPLLHGLILNLAMIGALFAGGAFLIGLFFVLLAKGSRK